MKSNSAPQLYDFVGADLFRSAGKLDHISRLINVPRPSFAPHCTTKGMPPDGIPRVFVVNWQLPDYNPPSVSRGCYR